MGERYRVLDGKLVTIEEWWRAQKPVARSSLPSPYFISDQLDIQSMADGKHYDSKQSYYRSLKDRGLEIIGNDAPREARGMDDGPGDLEQDIKNSIEQLRSQP